MKGPEYIEKALNGSRQELMVMKYIYEKNLHLLYEKIWSYLWKWWWSWWKFYLLAPRMERPPMPRKADTRLLVMCCNSVSHTDDFDDSGSNDFNDNTHQDDCNGRWFRLGREEKSCRAGSKPRTSGEHCSLDLISDHDHNDNDNNNKQKTILY